MSNERPSKLAPIIVESAPIRREIIRALQQAIESGYLPSGALISERDLCERFGVSRTSMREALRELEGKNLLIRRGRKLAVPAADEGELRTAYHLRLRVEALVVEYVIDRATEMQLTLVAAAGEKLAQHLDADAVGEARVARTEFYDVLYTVADSPLAADTLNNLRLRTSFLRARSINLPRNRARSAIHIRRLIEAISARRVDAAISALEDHIRDLADASLRVPLAVKARI